MSLPVSPFSDTYVPVPGLLGLMTFVSGPGAGLSHPPALGWPVQSSLALLPPLCHLRLCGYHSQVFQRPGQQVAGSGDTSSREVSLCSLGALRAHCFVLPDCLPVERGQRKGCTSTQHRLSHSEVRPATAWRQQSNRCGSWADTTFTGRDGKPCHRAARTRTWRLSESRPSARGHAGGHGVTSPVRVT